MQFLVSIMEINTRPRRLRSNPILREMVAETRLSPDMFIYPYFVNRGLSQPTPVASMPGVVNHNLDTLLKDVEKGLSFGVNKILLFGSGEPKDAKATASGDSKGCIPSAIRELKKAFGNDVYVITDVCLCAYTDHGHCGLVDHGTILNDSSLPVLNNMALAHAEAGVDMVSPSDMMDGRVSSIREALDGSGFTNIPLMSYSVKYASSYYGPFRDAADSSPQSGDRKSYQMDFRNSREAVKEALIDVEEGADILMVKPALAYLDVISKVKQLTDLPVACYNVSGEYAMVKAAAANGWINEERIVMENMFAFARAGADIIISYHTRDILEKGWLKK